MTKLRRAHSSAMLFWMGVPVNSSLFLDWNSLRIFHLCESTFLMAWASSRIINCHFNLLKVFSSATVSWYEVITTWKGESALSLNFLVEKNRRRVFLCLMFPQYGRTFKDGQNRLNYCCQLNKVLFGAMMRNGPHIPFFYETWPNRAIAWIVFPRPISSARMPLIPC